MNIDDGYIRKISNEDSLKDREILIPKDSEELVINMTRQQRRAWARAEVKRLQQEIKKSQY